MYYKKNVKGKKNNSAGRTEVRLIRMCWPLPLYNLQNFMLHITSSSCAPLRTLKGRLIATRQQCCHQVKAQVPSVASRWWCNRTSMCHIGQRSPHRNEATRCRCEGINIFHGKSHFGVTGRRLLSADKQAQSGTHTHTHLSGRVVYREGSVSSRM